MKVCIPYQPSATGGPSTFYRNLTSALTIRGDTVVPTPTADCTAMLAIIYCHPRLLWQARRLGVPIVQRLDGVHYTAVSGTRSWRLNLPIWLNYRFFSSHIIFQSEYSRRQCLHFLGRPHAAESVIYNGVDTQTFTPDGEARSIGNGRVVLSILSSYKRAFELETVITAFEQLKDAHPDLQLIIAGEIDPQLDWLVNSHPEIHWLGTLPHSQLPMLYRAATLFLSAKLRQNCPNAILETMATGIPTACFDSGAHRELLGDEAGLCVPLPTDDFGPFPPLDALALAQAASTILSNEATYRRNARRRAVHQFTLGKMVDAYVAVFDSLTQTNPS